ncbi:MAG: hypothetical protein ACTSRS_05700 [Candidatus Helarchaeota archaeon]
MCEFKIKVAEPGKPAALVVEDISYLKSQFDDGKIILRGLGIRESVETALIKEVNVYGEEGASAELFKAPIIQPFLKVLKNLENGTYSKELEESWKEFIEYGEAYIQTLKKV